MKKDTKSILEYHLETSHARGTLTGRALNWGDQPVPFKLYRDIPVFHLPQDLSWPEIPLDRAMDFRPPYSGTSMPALLAGICNLTAGITQVKKQGEDSFFHFRAMASAGALYPTELYVALQNITGMNDGLYHYCPLEHTMCSLRAGQVFSALAGDEPIIRFYLTTIFHRSAWKYGPRAYRYCLLDAGHMAENLLLSTRIHGLHSRLDYDFDDGAINEFLCLDPKLEACLAQVHALGCSPETEVYSTVPPKTKTLPSFSRSAAKSTAPEELLYAHLLCSATGHKPAPLNISTNQDTTSLPASIVPASTSATIQRRRSRRNFIPKPTSTRDFVDILSLLCRDNNAKPPCTDAIQVGFLAGETSGLTPGYHHLNRTTCATTLIKIGNLMPQMARICLDQGWLDNAAMHIVFTADIKTLEMQNGPRAYRYAHLEAGRIGQRVYLAATAKNLGVCGIGAFFDRDGATLLGLPEGHALLYLIAIGPIKRA